MQIRQVLASFQYNIFASSFYQKQVRIGNFYHFIIIPVRLSCNLCNTLQNKTKQEAQMSQCSVWTWKYSQTCNHWKLAEVMLPISVFSNLHMYFILKLNFHLVTLTLTTFMTLLFFIYLWAVSLTFIPLHFLRTQSRYYTE